MSFDLSNGSTRSTFEHRSSINIENESFVIGNALSPSELPEQILVDAKERPARKIKKGFFEDPHKKEKRAVLSRHAKNVLLDWYNARISNPYARHAEIVVLAKAAGIETSQAQKWLANKRVRSGNTLPTNELMKLREATKIQEIQKILQVGELPKCSKSKKARKIKSRNTVVTTKLSQQPDWGNYCGDTRLAQPRSQFSVGGRPPFSSFSFGGTNGGVNPWLQGPGALVPMINPYTGQSMVCNSASGMPFPFPAIVPFFPAMVPFFPWQLPSSTSPSPPPLASCDVNIASHRIQSTPGSVSGEARGIGENAMHGTFPFVNVPQLALPSFAEYLAFQRSMLGGTVTPSSDPVI